MTEAILRDRTKEFAKRIIRLVDALPNTVAGRAQASQIVRSGTSVAANYRALCRAKSSDDFICKAGIIEEETDESALWLELIAETKILPAAKVKPLLQESNELVAIFVASRKTLRARRGKIENRKSKIENSHA